MMEAPEEVAPTQIVKGKRTKRQRVQSPIPFSLTTNSPSGDDCTNGKNSQSLSPTSFNSNNNNNEFQDSTEGEEDMANCLILLAQGCSRDVSRQDDDNDTGIYYNSNNNNNNNMNIKFNSRRFLETASNTGSGKVGYYVYECKTCSRTFPSFQALGGHRASHKKAKAATTATHKDEKKHLKMMNLSSSDEEEANYKNISSLSLQLGNDNNGRFDGNQSKGKVHECSICGAEFTSGQALGGHMRRHRTPVGASSTALSLKPMAIGYEEPPKKARNSVISLDLDLNFPAPEDDKFSFASKQQQQQQKQQQQQENPPLVFSSQTLVDCHY